MRADAAALCELLGAVFCVVAAAYAIVQLLLPCIVCCGVGAVLLIASEALRQP